jgi:pyruvate dehydrogenase E2 component (dihydrolipoamide acetyltransferase)
MTDVVMPQMGESVTEGTVTRWLKQIGERVERDEPLLEISTDMVDAEVPAPATGVLHEILVSEGTTVTVGTVLARVTGTEQIAERAADVSAPGDRPAPPQPAVEAAPLAPPATTPETSEFTVEAQSLPAAQIEELRRTRSSPLVRRMAADNKVDLSALRGTGLDGRVTRQDLENYLAKGGPPQPATTSLAVTAPTPPPPPQPAEETEGAVVLSPLQRRTAEQMAASHHASAHAVTVFEVDLTSIERLREARSRRDTSPTPLAFIVKATADALRTNPLLNASVEEQRIVYHKEVHVGVTVSLERGLVVPVIRHADGKSVADLARELADLAERARTRRLRPNEVQHATFTISDASGLGALFGVPIIEQPQVAVLSVGAIEKRPLVVGDAIAIRSMAFLALGFDQRLIETSDADRFMGQLKRGLAALAESAL